MAESIKISELDELVSGSVLGTTKVPVVDGGATKYAQASSIKAFVNSDVATDAELASQIASVNSTIDGLTTADISENVSYKYYTDARVTTQLNALSVLSGSSTSLTVSDNGDVNVSLVDKITFTNATVFDAGSGDVTVTIDIPSTLSVIDTVGPTVVNGVDQITFDGATVTNNGSGDITVTIDGSSTDISLLNTFTGSIRGEINGIEAFTASFSSSVENRITSLETASITLPNGLLSSSQQITDFGFISESAGTTIPQGTVSSSQQIVGLGFVTTGSLATGTNYHIISQSIIATEPIDSNLLLSSVYIDKTKTITFSQFSQSIDSRVGAGGGSDYISNVTFDNNRLTFTGVGSAFNDYVGLPNGLVSSSVQLNGFGFLTSTDVNTTYISDRLPNGLVSGSTQISSFGFLNNASNIVSSSAQIVLLNTVSGGFDTSHISENEFFQYYTDNKVTDVINSLQLVSGSVLPSCSVSSSSQIDYQLIYNKPLFYTGSSNVFITSGSQSGAGGYGSPWVQIQVLSPTLTEFNTLSNSVYTSGLISGSAQISDLGFIDDNVLDSLNFWTGSSGGFSVISQSINLRINNVESNIGAGGSTTLSGLTDTNFNSLFSGEILTYNSSAGYWENTKQLSGNYVITGSLILTGSIEADSLIVTGSTTNTLTVNGTSTFEGTNTFNQNSTFNGAVYNSVDAFIASPGAGTASLDFSTGNYFQIVLDPASTGTTHISASNELEGQVVTVLLQCGLNSTASFSTNIKQPATSFYTASQSGEYDVITFTTFGTGVYLTSLQKNFV